jgi:hypothetical protein
MFPRTTAASADDNADTWFDAALGVANDRGCSSEGDRCDMINQVTPAPTAAESSIGSR